MITKCLTKAGKPISTILVVLLLFCAYLLGSVSPVHAATIIIAASNSTSQWKSQATAVCSGNADQTVINKYLTAGNTVELAPGTFNIYWPGILPSSSTHLYGQGNTTIINLYNVYIDVHDVSNVEIDHLEITGAGQGLALFIEATSTSVSNFYIHDIYCNATVSNDFEVWMDDEQVGNVTFSRCSAVNPDGNGFSIFASGATNNLINNVTFYKCSVQNAGVASSRLGPYIVGFDTGENIDSGDEPDLSITNMYLIDCSVNGAWESDYHIEYGPATQQNIVFTGCNAQNAGRNPSYILGYGFKVQTGDVVEYNNTASSNAGGDLLLYNTTYTPIINGINPPNSVKTATALNQSNCSGVIINTDSTHKELVLYSNDGNAVNQQIDLGNYYAADDGNTYSFNGTRILVQFSDYTVIKLVQTTSLTVPSVNTNSTSNLTSTGATINANLNSLGSASSVTVSFEYGLTTDYGSTAVGVPSTMTGTGAFNASLTGLIPNTLYHYQAVVVGNNGTAYGGDQTFTTSTSPAALTITTNTLTNGTVGVAYSQTLVATGGTAPYTWTIASGKLPTGLTLSSSGVISGTPTAAISSTSVTFKVTDANSITATQSLSITTAYAAWDINMDGSVNVLDMTLISQYFGQTGTPGWIREDVNNDGVVNIQDLIIVGQHLSE
jgi:hypothetical protein